MFCSRDFFFFMVLGWAVLFGQSGVAYAEKITAVADLWCPYNCDPASDRPGILVEIAKKAFAKHGIDFEYTLMPWARAVESVRDGKYHAAIGAAHGDAPDFIFPDVAQSTVKMSFFGLQDSEWTFDGMESLDRISLGAIADYSYDGDLDSYIEKYGADRSRVQVIGGEDAVSINIKKLLKGRIDAFIESRNVAFYEMSSYLEKDKIKILGSLPASANDDVYVAFSPKGKKSKHYADILTKETQAMIESGEFQEILYRYGIEKVEENNE